VGLANTESAASSVIGILIYLTFTFVFIDFKPYKSKQDSNLCIVLIYCLEILFLSALLIKVDAAPDDEDDQQLFGILLVVVLFIGPLMIVLTTAAEVVAELLNSKNKPSKEEEEEEEEEENETFARLPMQQPVGVHLGASAAEEVVGSSSQQRDWHSSVLPVKEVKEASTTLAPGEDIRGMPPGTSL
jgi:hypothetical protein